MTANSKTMAIFSKSLEKNFYPQLIIPELAQKIGLDENIVLQQVHYWLQKCGKSIENKLWIYNTFEQWKDQFSYWSLSKIKRVFYSLEEQGIIFSKKMNVDKSNHTKWYTINYRKLIRLLRKLIPRKSIKNKKKFTQIQNELSSSQSDTIIYKSSKNNSQENIFLSNDKQENQESNLKNDRQKDSLNSQKEICQSMLQVWNSVFLNNHKNILLTERRIIKLSNLWEKVFNQDIEQWRKFCILVNSSKFLMGEKKQGFKAYFDWLIEESTARKVLAGELGIGDRVPDIEQEALKLKNQEIAAKVQLKADEELKAKAEEEKKREIEKLAFKLMAEELEAAEKKLTEKDLSTAKDSFESYVKNVANDDKQLSGFKKLFSEYGWNAPFVDHFFDEFKTRVFLNKEFSNFIEQAKMVIQ